MVIVASKKIKQSFRIGSKCRIDCDGRYIPYFGRHFLSWNRCRERCRRGNRDVCVVWSRRRSTARFSADGEIPAVGVDNGCGELGELCFQCSREARFGNKEQGLNCGRGWGGEFPVELGLKDKT